MTVSVGIAGPGIGTDGDIRRASVFERENAAGIVAYTEERKQFNPQFIPFLNPTNGTNMAVNASFGGVPAFVYESGGASTAISGTTTSQEALTLHDTGGGFTAAVSVGMVVRDSASNFAHVTVVDSDIKLTLDADIMGSGETYTIGTEWPGTATTGSGWDFTTDITVTSANNNDTAQFDNAYTSVMSNYVALTGDVTLTTWNDVANSLNISFQLAGTPVGNSVDLNDYIDTGVLGSSQVFVIPKADFGLSSQTVDDMVLVVTRSGGTRPTLSLDNIQLENTSGSVAYQVTTPPGTRYHASHLRFAMADEYDGTLAANSAPNLSYNKLLGVAKLTNGIQFQRVQKAAVNFTVILRQLADFLQTGSVISDFIDDGTNVMLVLEVAFSHPIILEGDNGDNFLSLTLSDDLSGLLVFNASTRGALEI